MGYFKTKHQKHSARLTTVIMLLLILLLFIVGPGYMDPPLEYGVAVNFGTTDTGSGAIQPKKPLASQSTPVSEPVVEPVKAAPPVESSEPAAAEEVLTSEDLESIAIKKAEAETAKLKADADAKVKAETEATAKAQAEAKAKADAEAKAEEERLKKEADIKAKKKQELDALMGGIGTDDGTDTGSEGDDDTPGDKGQLNGDPYAPSYFGSPGSGNGGVGYGLNGRGRPSKTKVIPDCDEEGKVVVEIHVNQKGNVVKAIPGKRGTTGDICLYEAAKKTALTHKWPADSKAPAKQIGFVIVDFSVRQ
ncbi:TonB family domain protein [Formosa sp. Hel1_33_131]|uniref:energy transducer TonB n=1 Tax=Formosa sp. Hel1_33_131 TaxID=1336794 RepID=UPI00084E11B6|nr:energy transducer TonB [Formosa sp. Hel1_33_131]AOR28835.1 TonB family domain protein [Formosa sp. Hel1_33_131]